jgi:hypothetical protein
LWVYKGGFWKLGRVSSLCKAQEKIDVTWVQRTHTDQTYRLTPMFFSHVDCVRSL